MAEKVKQENTIIKSDFYKELKTQRGIIESQLIFSLYGDTNYFFDYPVNPNDISNSMWRFYYHMLKEMVEDRGLKTLDAVSVGAYVNSKEEKIQKAYSEAGGYETIEKGIAIVEKENVDSYYNELQRYKTLMKLTEMGFPIKQNWDKYQEMDLETLNEVLEGLIAEAFVDSQFGNDRVEEMFDDVDEMLKEADEGIAQGLPLGSPLMDSIQNGLALGNITMLAANSGVGKTFLTTLLHIQSSINNEEPVLIIANEEEKADMFKDY